MHSVHTEMQLCFLLEYQFLIQHFLMFCLCFHMTIQSCEPHGANDAIKSLIRDLFLSRKKNEFVLISGPALNEVATFIFSFVYACKSIRVMYCL